jgi:DNA-binding transcriptional LysR family regulator
MHAVHLSSIDVNLLVALRALLETRNVTAAGRRLGLSPSATSHALARLRGLLGDPLLVRAGRALILTPRASALAEPLAQALEALETALAPREALDPRTLARSFRIETTDHVQFVLLRALDARAREESPRVNIYLQSLQPETFARLREGAIDLAISVYNGVDADLERQNLFDDRLVAVMRRGHPALRRRMTLARFAALDHLLVAPNGSPTGLVDRLLADHGLRRRVARTSSTFLDIAFLVADTDYVVSLPETVARPLLGKWKLEMVRLPLPLPTFTHSMVWHRRYTKDPAHAWFRGLVAAATKERRG